MVAENHHIKSKITTTTTTTTKGGKGGKKLKLNMKINKTKMIAVKKLEVVEESETLSLSLKPEPEPEAGPPPPIIKYEHLEKDSAASSEEESSSSSSSDDGSGSQPQYWIVHLPSWVMNDWMNRGPGAHVADISYSTTGGHVPDIRIDLKSDNPNIPKKCTLTPRDHSSKRMYIFGKPPLPPVMPKLESAAESAESNPNLTSNLNLKSTKMETGDGGDGDDDTTTNDNDNGNDDDVVIESTSTRLALRGPVQMEATIQPVDSLEYREFIHRRMVKSETHMSTTRQIDMSAVLRGKFHNGGNRDDIPRPVAAAPAPTVVCAAAAAYNNNDNKRSRPLESSSSSSVNKRARVENTTAAVAVTAAPTIFLSNRTRSRHGTRHGALAKSKLKSQNSLKEKRFRAPVAEVKQALFKAFNIHRYYRLKELGSILNQPEEFLKHEILPEMCDFITSADTGDSHDSKKPKIPSRFNNYYRLKLQYSTKKDQLLDEAIAAGTIDR